MELSTNETGKFLEAIWGDDPGTRFVSVSGKNGGWRDIPHNTNEDALRTIEDANKRGDNVFFAVHLFEPGSDDRKASKATTCRALFLDIDVGKGKQYSDQETALLEVVRCTSDSELPDPVFVNSGFGLHLYWFLDQALSSDEWAIAAGHLRTILEAQGLKFDSGVKDKSRVLRVPGTMNGKDPEHPKRCETISEEITFHDPADIQAILDKHTPAQYENAAELNDPFLSGLETGSEFSKTAAKLCLQFITGEQVTDYTDWMRVGFALWNTFDGSSEGLQLWDEVSKRSAKYKPGVCKEKWQTMGELAGGEKATVGTLHEMARVVAGEDFLKEWRSESLIAKASEIGADDMGNAQRLVTLHGENIRYDWPRRVWYAFTGTHWKEDAEAEVMQLAKATARNILVEAAKTESDTRRSKLISWSKTSASGVHLREMLRLAMDEPDIQATISDFDNHPHLLCVENGVIDTRTRKLLPHDRDLRLTRCLPILYDPAAECPVFEAFLDRIFEGNVELIDYVLRALGYAITGENSEHVLFMCYGEGANGKSTLIETIQFILGDLAGTVRTEALMQDKFGGNSGHNDDIANLHGKRFVAASEGESGQRFSESRIKQITGGDTISASRKYGRTFQFEPIFTLFLATNHKPQISQTDEGIWRRIRLIPFNVCIPEDERDPELKLKLRSEAKGILAKLVRGASDWYAAGLGKEPGVIDATADYRREQDSVENFLDEMCDLEQGLTAVPAMLFDSYRQWCVDNGIEPLNRQAFPAELKKKGYKKQDVRQDYGQNRKLWQGIGIRNSGFSVR